MTTYFVVVAAHTKIFLTFPHFDSELLKKILSLQYFLKCTNKSRNKMYSLRALHFLKIISIKNALGWLFISKKKI